MKLLYFFSFLLITNVLICQNGNSSELYSFKNVDLDKVDEKKLYTLIDSLYYQPKVDSLLELYYVVSRDKKRYTSFNLGSEISFASLDELNFDLKNLGLKSVNETFASISEGISVRGNRLLNSFQLNFVLPNKIENQFYKLSVSGGNLLAWNIGYDLINLNSVSFYPLAGIYHQFYNIEIENKYARDQEISEIIDLFNKYQQSFFSRSSIGYSLGVQTDFHLHKGDRGGVIFAFRFSINENFSSGNFKFDNKSILYSPSTSLRNSAVQFFFKFYAWNKKPNRSKK